MNSNHNDLDFLEVFNENNALIYKFIFLRTGFNKETAEDLTQEVFYKALRKFEEFDTKKASVKTWLFRIARNQVIDFYRKNAHKPYDIEQVEEIGIEDKNIELTDFIFTKMKELKEQEQEIILYKYIYEFSEKEIAKIIKKNYIATRVLVHRTLNKLKKIVNETN